MNTTTSQKTLSHLLENKEFWLYCAVMFAERFIYYGFRSFVILFFIDSIESGGLGIDSTEAIASYGVFTMVVYLSSIAGGILGDATEKHNLISILGLILFTLGIYLLSQTDQDSYNQIFMFIAFSSGIIKPNIWSRFANIARQMPTFSYNLFAGAMVFVNIGAFLAPITIGLFSESVSFTSALILCVVLSILPIAIMFYCQLKPVKEPQSSKDNNHQLNQLSPVKQHNSRGLKAFSVIFVILFANILYWAFFEILYTEFYNLENATSEFMQTSLIASLLPIAALILGFLFFHKTVSSVAFNLSLTLGGIAIAGIVTATFGPFAQSIKWFIMFTVILAFCELLITTISFVAITKYAHHRIIATCFGLFFLSHALSAKLTQVLMEQNYIMELSIICAIMAVASLIAFMMNRSSKSPNC